MKKIGIFYGSNTGNTKTAADLLAKVLPADDTDLINVSSASGEQLLSYEILFLGSSTWGVGDLQDDWEDFIVKLSKQNLTGKHVAVFGTGNSSTFSDSFCDAIGTIAEAAQKSGATIIGNNVSRSGYSFDESKAFDGNTFCGLPLDMENDPDKTTERIANWISQIKSTIPL